MNDSTNGYHNGNGNGNGNGHQKAFSIGPPREDMTGKILGVRIDCIEDSKMDPGARLMFCYLLDNAVREGSYEFFGAVAMSQSFLAKKIGCSLRTIWNYKSQLVQSGYVWMTLKPIPNCVGMDLYHIAVLCKRQHEKKTTAEGHWGNGSRRIWQNPGMGAREPGQLHLRGNLLRRTPTGSENGEMPENTAVSRNGLQETVATHCHGEPQPVAAASSNPLPRPAETDCHGEPQPVATASRNGLPRAAATGCEHKKAIVNSFSHPETTHTAIELPRFEELDRKCAARLRPDLGGKMIERCKLRITTLEQSREPVPGAKEIIAAYKARIKAVNKWIAGEL